MGCNLRIAGDADTLVKLDGLGLLAGADESVEQYLSRLRKLQTNIAEMEAALASSGQYSVEGLTLRAKDRIKASFFEKAHQQCQALYGFSAEWVPGFFINPDFSLLFGGCSFSFLPDFFALFIIRRSFKSKERWLIYGRNELLAHEMCHVARSALESITYEETFAYQTSNSAFRRLLGGLFLRQADSFLLLGSTLLVLFAQIVRLFAWATLPIQFFWMLPAAVLAWLLLRYCGIRCRMSRALKRLNHCYGANSNAVLFRCTDAEIDMLAAGHFPDAFNDMTKARSIVLNSLRE